MRRTTLKLDETVLRRLKQQAAAQGTTLQELANALLRRALSRRDREPFTLALTPWEAELQPGANILDRDTLFDLMNGR